VHEHLGKQAAEARYLPSVSSTASRERPPRSMSVVTSGGAWSIKSVPPPRGRDPGPRAAKASSMLAGRTCCSMV
jgi:hypothetical protein